MSLPSRALARHPLLRDALLWAIPALLVGLALRLILLSYSPYAYWGSDSRSFFGFTNGVMTDFYFSINEKRRYLYPILLLPLTWLPGSTLKAVAWVQAGLGLATILPFAYFIRRVFTGWKWLIVPLTVVYAGLPVFLWYEHELIADTIMFDCVVWSLAGWAAWICQADLARARRLWWWFLVPFAIMALTKPSVKFFWPGLLAALVIVLAWRRLGWKQWLALALVFFAGATVGDDDQSARLLYTTAFPLTRVDTPKNAEYKAEIRDWVIRKRDRIDLYDEEDDPIHDFLREPGKQNERPLWRDLAKKDSDGLDRLYRSLALEGILARPDLFLYIGLQRLVGCANLDDFKTDRFESTYFADRFADALAHDRNPDSMIQLAFALPLGQPLPDAAQFHRWLAPAPDSAAARWMLGYVDAYERAGRLIDRPTGLHPALDKCRPTPVGWLLALGLLLSLIPPCLRTLGVWNLILLGYLLTVFLVGIEHTRYFAPVWPLVILSLGMVIEWPLRLLAMRKSRTTTGA